MTDNNPSPVARWYSHDRPEVSIVILNFNKSHLTMECLQSLWTHTQEHRYEIIVVDNGSQAAEFHALSAFTPGPYTLLRLEVNRFFGEGNNIGAEQAKGDFVLFMNNDVTVTPNWLPPLLRVFQECPDCGAAGPKFLYPNGRLQEAGALMDEQGGSVQIGKFQDPSLPRFNRRRVVDYVSAAAVLMKKETFERVLGFDCIYEPAYYEDVDLCLKIGQLGLKTYYVPESCVIHHENATTSDQRHGLQLHNIVAVNQGKFVDRWNGYLKTGRHDGPVPEPVPLIRGAQSQSAPTAAIYTPYNIIPGGGERYLLTTAEALIRAGYRTTLLTPERFSSVRITKIADTLGLDLQGLTIATVKDAQPSVPFDVFVAMGNEIAPPVRALGRTSFYCCQFPFPCAPDEIERRRPHLAGYDAFIVYSDFVKNNVLKQLARHRLPQLDVRIVQPPVDLQPFDSTSARTGILSVGRFFTGDHCKRHDMLIRAFRRLCESGIDTELHLAGSLHPEPQHRQYFIDCQRLAQGLPVFFHVDAPHQRLSSLYQRSSVYWHGAGFGVDSDRTPERCEHFGISVVEAMSAGAIPLVANNGGPATTVTHGRDGYCYDSESALIEITQRVLGQQAPLVSPMRERARTRAMQFSKESFEARWRELLNS